mmetsp:Transcript_9626/g.33097  ORF Transcript_9626/g.33097 Transcript_9626/m.33097 type:complete len:322 (-) Transcript_9626:209-1174(-)
MSKPGTSPAWSRDRSGGSRGLPSNGGLGAASATTRKFGCTASSFELVAPSMPRKASKRAAGTRKRPSSSAISRFSSRLFSSGRTLRSARSTPWSTSTRPWSAASTGGWFAQTRAPSRISRRCLRSPSDVSRVKATNSHSRPSSSQNCKTSARGRGPGSPMRNMSCFSASFCIIQRSAAIQVLGMGLPSRSSGENARAPRQPGEKGTSAASPRRFAAATEPPRASATTTALSSTSSASFVRSTPASRRFRSARFSSAAKFSSSSSRIAPHMTKPSCLRALSSVTLSGGTWASKAKTSASAASTPSSANAFRCSQTLTSSRAE